MNRILIAAFFSLLCGSAFALGIESTLPDPAQEARARALFHEIRCVVCAGESIADSPADVAHDMRGVIRVQIQNGQSETAIKDMLVARYGEHVLMTPPLNPQTLLLWFGPLGILACAACMAFVYFRRVSESERRNV